MDGGVLNDDEQQTSSTDQSSINMDQSATNSTTSYQRAANLSPCATDDLYDDVTTDKDR
jgi:hypothetical protein